MQFGQWDHRGNTGSMAPVFTKNGYFILLYKDDYIAVLLF